MRLFQIAVTLSLAVILCSSAYALRIDTTAGGDGCYVGVFGSGAGDIINEYVTNVSGSGLDETLDMQYTVSGFRYETRAVVVFSLASLQGLTLQPGDVSLNFWAVTAYPAPEAQVELHHMGGNTGPSLSLPYGRTSLATYVTDLTFPDEYNSVQPGWQSVDVTSQILADIAHGFSYSSFAFRVYDWETFQPLQADAQIMAYESGYGAYLNAVPEPASIAGLLSGLFGCGILLKRRVK